MREAAWGGGLLLPLLAERLRVSGDGVAAQRAYVTAAPIKRKSALGDYPLFLGIGRPRSLLSAYLHLAAASPLLVSEIQPSRGSTIQPSFPAYPSTVASS